MATRAPQPRNEYLGSESVVAATDAPEFALAPRPDTRSEAWTAISLFSGGGGLDLGFAYEGIYARKAYEFDAAACRAHSANLDGSLVRCDLSKSLPEASRADVLLAGAPCQGFSTLGKREPADPRNGLLARIATASAIIRPKVVVVENVPAALSGLVRSHWLRLEAALRDQGMNVRRFRLDASEHGVPQTRKRLFVIAWRGSEHIHPTFLPQPGIASGAAIAAMEGEDCVIRLPNRRETLIAQRIAPGQKLSNVRFSNRCVHTWDIPEVFGKVSDQEKAILVAVGRLRRRKRVRDHGDGDPVDPTRLAHECGFDCEEMIASLIEREYLRRRDSGIEMFHTFNGKYRRIDPTAPSPTVDTHFGRMTNFIHPHSDRALSLRETMRFQGFPDWYRIDGSEGAAFRICGNAVPPPLSRTVARIVREAILKA